MDAQLCAVEGSHVPSTVAEELLCGGGTPEPSTRNH